MITVTRLDGTPIIVNSDQIAWIECHPDTVVSLIGGEKLIVREAPELLVERVVEFRRTIAVEGRRPGLSAADLRLPWLSVPDPRSPGSSDPGDVLNSRSPGSPDPGKGTASW